MVALPIQRTISKAVLKHVFFLKKFLDKISRNKGEIVFIVKRDTACILLVVYDVNKDILFYQKLYNSFLVFRYGGFRWRMMKKN